MTSMAPRVQGRLESVLLAPIGVQKLPQLLVTGVNLLIEKIPQLLQLGLAEFSHALR